MDQDLEYGYRLGLADGRVAARWIKERKPVDHGGLLSAIDPYAAGYREGLKEEVNP